MFWWEDYGDDDEMAAESRIMARVGNQILMVTVNLKRLVFFFSELGRYKGNKLSIYNKYCNIVMRTNWLLFSTSNHYLDHLDLYMEYFLFDFIPRIKMLHINKRLKWKMTEKLGGTMFHLALQFKPVQVNLWTRLCVWQARNKMELVLSTNSNETNFYRKIAELTIIIYVILLSLSHLCSSKLSMLPGHFLVREKCKNDILVL